MSRAALGAALGVSESVVIEIEDGSFLIDGISRKQILALCGFWAEWRQGIVRDRMRLKPLGELHGRMRESVGALRAKVAADTPSPALSDLSNLASLLRGLGETADAVPVLERAIAIAEGVPGGVLPGLHIALACALQELGNLDGACGHAERALAIGSTEHPDDLPSASRLFAYASMRRDYAFILRDKGRLADAKRAARESLELEAKVRPDMQRSGVNLERHVLLAQPEET